MKGRRAGPMDHSFLVKQELSPKTKTGAGDIFCERDTDRTERLELRF